jgi:hypothetical protein
MELIAAGLVFGFYWFICTENWWKYRILLDLYVFSAFVNGLAATSRTVYTHTATLDVIMWFIVPWALGIAYGERRQWLERQKTGPIMRD